MSNLGLNILPKAGRNAFGKLFKSRLLSPNIPACTQLAKLTSVNSITPPESFAKHRPFAGRQYFWPWQFVDSATKRFTDNSRIILVEGNVATGKAEFAKKIAAEFDMLYLPDIDPDSVNIGESSGFDYKEWNKYFKRTIYHDRESMFSSEDPQKDQLCALTQYKIYKARYHNYCDAFTHVFNSGQGVVMSRSVFSDAAFAYAMRRAKLLSRGGFAHYQEIVDATRSSLYMPHLIIYLDGTIPYCRSQINKRNKSWEVNSNVLTDEFLQNVEYTYKSSLLPLFEKYCEVLTLDPAKPIDDWELFVDQLEGLKLEGDSKNPSDADKFHDWTNNSETNWDTMRLFNSSRWKQEENFPIKTPIYAPEIRLTEEELAIVRTLWSEYDDVIPSELKSEYS